MCVVEFSTGNMFLNRKLAKRSILGTRVCALWPQDGRFHPGSIQSLVRENSITQDAVYVVRFDNGFSLNIRSRNIVGPGFQSVTSTILKWGQKVYFTLNGREIGGIVLQHDRDLDQVVMSVKTPSGEYFDTTRKLEDIRLFESRKSARLVDQIDTDYSKLADLQLNVIDPPSTKRRPTSHVIEVPAAFKKHNYRRHLPRQRRVTEKVLIRDHQDGEEDVVSMDETEAAMALTSLSVSPSSPPWRYDSAQSENRDHPERYSPYPESHLPRSLAGGGFYGGLSERNGYSSHSSLAPLSESAPAKLTFEHSTLTTDEDSSNGYDKRVVCEENKETIFKCTWRGCNVVTTSRDLMERHIRRTHFDRDSDLELTDNEEDFHYTEMDAGQQSFNTMTRCFAALNTSSQNIEQMKDLDIYICEQKRENKTHVPHKSASVHTSNSADSLDNICTSSDPAGRQISDHDYQTNTNQNQTNQNQTLTMPSSETNLNEELAAILTVTMDEGQIRKSLSWKSNPSSPGDLISSPQKSNKLMLQERLTQHQAQSPKSNMARTVFKVTQYKRTRTEVRKCRKVFGMENRDQWCTQCKWKKACTRFIK